MVIVSLIKTSQLAMRTEITGLFCRRHCNYGKNGKLCIDITPGTPQTSRSRLTARAARPEQPFLGGTHAVPRGQHRWQSPTGRPREWVGHGRAQVGTWVTGPRLSPRLTPGCLSLASGGTAKPDAHQQRVLQEPCPARAPRASELSGENGPPAPSPPGWHRPPQRLWPCKAHRLQLPGTVRDTKM